MTDLELRVYATTVRGEAGGEGERGMAAVAWVVRNRVVRPPWPNGVVAVCLQPLQFSFWNGDSPRRAALLTDESELHRAADRICSAVWDKRQDDPTGGADHYHALAVRPGWAETMLRTVTIGGHHFFNSKAART